jgi:hypothetical protein
MIRYRMASFRRLFRPPPLPRVILASKSRTRELHLPSNTWKMCGNGSRRGGGGGMGIPLAAFLKQGNIVFG